MRTIAGPKDRADLRPVAVDVGEQLDGVETQAVVVPVAACVRIQN